MSYPAWWCQWCVCLYTHQCVCVACAYYMYAFVSSPDHSLRPGELPGEAPGIYLSLPEYHGVWRRQHPLPEGGMWRVSLRALQQTDLLGKSSRKLSFKQILRLFFAELQHKTSKGCSWYFLQVSQWSLCMCLYVHLLAADSWAGYEHSSFCGQQFVLERGEYPHWESWSGSNAYHIERMMSFRPICSAVSVCLPLCSKNEHLTHQIVSLDAPVSCLTSQLSNHTTPAAHRSSK